MSQLILVVEDDATMQKMALKILRSRGFTCESAPNGRAAVAMAGALKPGLILMDLSLPEMNGWEATRALKADPALAEIPVVAITAHAMVGDRVTAISAGCIHRLTRSRPSAWSISAGPPHTPSMACPDVSPGSERQPPRRGVTPSRCPESSRKGRRRERHPRSHSPQPRASRWGSQLEP